MVMQVTLRHVSGLQVLYASHNHLAELPDVFGPLVRLQLLHVGNNHLETLPPSLLHLIQLRALSACHNKIRQLPPGFLAAGELLLTDPLLSSNYAPPCSSWQQNLQAIRPVVLSDVPDLTHSYISNSVCPLTFFPARF